MTVSPASAVAVEVGAIEHVDTRELRHLRGEQADGDYINCPMDAEQYHAFVQGLLNAERIPLRDFEEPERFFEGCLAVEVMAATAL